MPIFKYKAINNKGKTIKGLVDASDKRQAAETLEERDLQLVSITEGSDDLELKFLYTINPIKIKDLVIFSRQFAVLISANVALVQALHILIDQTENIRLKIAISEMASEVDAGARLSDVMARRPEIFSSFFINVVRSGETSGRLDDILTYLANEMEKDYDLNSKIKGAMIYPIFVISGLFIVGGIMMVFVVPKLTAILTETGTKLPWATRMLINTSWFIAHFWWLIILAIIGLFMGVKAYIKTPQGKRNFDFLRLKLPVFGKLFQYIYLVRFTRSMNTLITGGVNISHSLVITADVIDNAVYKDLIKETARSVEDGNPLSTVFINSPEVPSMISHMMSVGEKTGKLDVILENISRFYSREVDGIISNLMALMEPFIMVMMGIGVGIMIAAIIMPMYNLSANF